MKMKFGSLEDTNVPMYYFDVGTICHFLVHQAIVHEPVRNEDGWVQIANNDNRCFLFQQSYGHKGLSATAMAELALASLLYDVSAFEGQGWLRRAPASS